MARIDEIKTELSTDPTKGLNAYQAGYLSTNTVQQNLDLINGDGVQRYRSSISGDELYNSFTSGALKSLAAGERDDFSAFISPLIPVAEIMNPEGVLKDLIDLEIFTNGTTDPAVRANFDAVIKEIVSPAVFLGLGTVDYSECEEAMTQLGWI